MKIRARVRALRALLAVVAAALLCVGIIATGGISPVGSSAAAAVDTSLAGDWVQSGDGTIIEFTATGQDTFSGEVVGDSTYFCLPINFMVSGNNGQYTGSDTFYSAPITPPTCGPSIGTGTVTIEIAADGATATVTLLPPGGVTCSNCGQVTWTRNTASFTVDGSDYSTLGQDGKQETGSPEEAKICRTLRGQYAYKVDEAIGQLTLGAWQIGRLSTAADFLADFLSGTGAEVDLPATSTTTAEIESSEAFIAEDKEVKADIAEQLAAGATQIHLPSGSDDVHALAFRNWNSRSAAERDLYFALRRTHSITVNGAGSLVDGNYVGSLTYVIGASYGFGEQNTLGGFGIAMRYLQTVCGTPYYPGGAHWFPATVTVTESLKIPAAGPSEN
jgi:hypothetical protein